MLRHSRNRRRSQRSRWGLRSAATYSYASYRHLIVEPERDRRLIRIGEIGLVAVRRNVRGCVWRGGIGARRVPALQTRRYRRAVAAIVDRHVIEVVEEIDDLQTKDRLRDAARLRVIFNRYVGIHARRRVEAAG